MTKEIASRSRALRRKRGYSQAELAQRSGVSLGSIKRFEVTGKISLISLVKVATALGRSDDLDHLFREKELPGTIEDLFK